MQLTNRNQKSTHSIETTVVESKKAYLTLTVYGIFYLILVLFQGLLPFNKTLVGLVTVVQLLICIFLTISVNKLSNTSSIFLYLFSLAIVSLAEFNRIICEAANLEIMIELSTLVFIAITYYSIGYLSKLNKLTIPKTM
ncbi:MAG: hypothetical protein HY818_12460 [Acetobacterium woodii]|nr:hypothetical protein [Acetobacterium woodii]